MTTSLDEPTDNVGTSETHVPKKRRIPSIINRHSLLSASLFIIISLVVFVFVSPLVIRTFFPSYDIVRKYTSIGVCTDAATQNSSVFLPISCASLLHSSTIGCISSDPFRYAAPAISTSDQKTLCSALISKPDTTGKKNVALAILPIDEITLKLLIAGTIMIGLGLLYVAGYALRRR